MAEIELFKRFPQAKALPYMPLGDFPTPVEHLARAGKEIGIPNLFVKRDDKTGTLYGGNKVRKLEFLLGDAQAKGCKEVWTVGAIGSHHVLATSLYARKLGLQPAALQFPQRVTSHVQEVLMALSTTHPKLTLIGNKNFLPAAVMKVKINEWLSTGESVYYIPGGGSSPVGVLGYVNAALELAAQIDAGEVPEPDFIFAAAGTCGTVAGLMIGCRLAGLKTRVIAVRVVDKIVCNAPLAVHLANKTADLLAGVGIDAPKIRHRDVTMLDDYFGAGYGEPTREGIEAQQLLARLEDVELEPTYTAKTFAGLIGERDRLELADKNVMYWHTLSSADLSPLIADAHPERDLPAEYQNFLKDVT